MYIYTNALHFNIECINRINTIYVYVYISTIYLCSCAMLILCYVTMWLCESSIEKRKRNDNGSTYTTDREDRTKLFKGKRHQI